MTVRYGTATALVLLLGISPVGAQSATAMQKHSRSAQSKLKQVPKAASVGNSMNHDLNSPSADFSKMQAPVTELGGQFKAGETRGRGNGRGLQPAMNAD